MNRRHDRLISELARTVVSDRACNQYSKSDGDLAANAVRRRNLRLYLEELERIGPEMLLIGEAPSYRGGRLTGIAFVNMLVQGIDETAYRTGLMAALLLVNFAFCLRQYGY